MKTEFFLKNSISDKTIYVKLNGKFEKQDGLNYMYRYINIIRNIDTKKYKLKFDCRNLSVSDSEALKVLIHCCKLYASAKFKKINAIIKPTQSLLLIQLNKVVKYSHLNNCHIISFSENIINLKTCCNYKKSLRSYLSSVKYNGYQIYYRFKNIFNRLHNIAYRLYNMALE